MAVTPDDPKQLLEDAARQSGVFSSYHPDTFPDELRDSDTPAFAIDPREEELEHESSGAHSGLYQQVPVRHVVYLAVESGPEASERSAARSALQEKRTAFLQAMHEEFGGTGGDAEKTSRTQSEVRNGEDILRVDAITIDTTQFQDYT